MKFLLVTIFFAVVALSAVYSVPVAEEFEDIDEFAYEGPAEGIRQRRVTCDLLSVGGKISLGDSACAANCLSMGKAGGRCNGGICQCRVTTFKELWDKRFG